MLKLTSFYRTAIMIGTALLNTAAATAQTAAAPQPAQRAASAALWVKSVKITAVPVPETDESRLLGLSMWRFTVVAPKPAHRVDFVVEAQESGKFPSEITRISLEPQSMWPVDQHLSVLIGVYPLYVPEKGLGAVCKYQVQVDGFRSSPSLMQGTSTESTATDNPFNGMLTSASGSPAQRSDNSVVLVSGYKHGPTVTENTPPNVMLVFRVQEEAN